MEDADKIFLEYVVKALVDNPNDDTPRMADDSTRRHGYRVCCGRIRSITMVDRKVQMDSVCETSRKR